MSANTNNCKIQVVTRHNPLPMEDGAGYYLWDIVSYLKESGFRIQIVWVKAEGWLTSRGFTIIPRTIARIADLRIIGGISIGRLIIFPGIWWLPFKARSLNLIKKLLCSLGIFSVFRKEKIAIKPLKARNEILWNTPPSKAEVLFFKKQWKPFKPDIVITSYPWMNPVLKEVKSKDRVPSFCITYDIQHQRSKMWEDKKPETGIDIITEDLERGYLSLVDVIVAITDYDSNVFQKMFPGKKVLTVCKASVSNARGGDTTPGRCLFVGGYAQTNIEGLRWFISDVWPKIIKECHDATFHVCGNVCKYFETNYQNVAFLGRLDSLNDEYSMAEVVVIPVLHGSGMNIKLVEALSFGKACVTTSIGIKGLPAAAEAVICGDSSDQFADAVIRLLRDKELRRRYEENGRDFACNNFSRERCYRPLVDAILETQKAVL